jgi:hypothetical protein
MTRRAATKVLAKAVVTAATTLAAVATTTLAAAPAHADVSIGSTPDGYSVGARQVRITSDSPAVPSGTVSLAVPVKCWWEEMPPNADLSGTFDASDSKAFQEYYDEMIRQMRGHAAAGYFAFPDRDYVQSILEREKAGTDYVWYRLEHLPGVDPVAECGATSRGTVGDAYGIGAGDAINQAIAISYRAFVAGTETPFTVDLGGLAEVLWDHADASIEKVALDRNPKIANGTGATLVNLSTWFWATNPGAALADDGTLRLEASVGNASAVLEAATDGVTVTSPVGARECTIEQIRTEYAPGVPEGAACAVELTRAGTWPVTATTTWTGSWTAQQGGESESGELDVIGRSSTVDVPVVESQALVSGVS